MSCASFQCAKVEHPGEGKGYPLGGIVQNRINRVQQVPVGLAVLAAITQENINLARKIPISLAVVGLAAGEIHACTSQSDGACAQLVLPSFVFARVVVLMMGQRLGFVFTAVVVVIEIRAVVCDAVTGRCHTKAREPSAPPHCIGE